MKRIVFGSSNHWTSPYQVGSHAWARLFARHDWSVAYISDPITPWHWLGRTGRERTRERWALWKSGGEWFENRTVRAWVPCSLVAPQSLPVFRSRWVMESWDGFTVPRVESQLCKWGFDLPDILWLDSVRHAGWGKLLRPRKTILRIADWSPGFSTTPASVIEAERRLLAEADLVIASSQSLEARLGEFRGNKPMLTIRNGVDAAFWKDPCPPPPEYLEIPAPRAVYVGALDEWFDVELLRQLAQRLSDVSFVIIGQRRHGPATDFSMPNIHWLGSRPREQVRAYVQHANVGIIPFKRNDLIECVCPLKLYEYMACGLPVVATRWDELERMNSPARLATGVGEWTAQLRQSLQAKQSAQSRDAEGESAYALSNDWQCRWLEWQAAWGKLA